METQGAETSPGLKEDRNYGEETAVTKGEFCTCAKHTLTKRQRGMNEHQRTFHYTHTHTQQKSTGTHILTASLQSIHITNTGMMCHQPTVAPCRDIRMRVGGE